MQESTVRSCSALSVPSYVWHQVKKIGKRQNPNSFPALIALTLQARPQPVPYSPEGKRGTHLVRGKAGEWRTLHPRPCRFCSKIYSWSRRTNTPHQTLPRSTHAPESLAFGFPGYPPPRPCLGLYPDRKAACTTAV